MRTTAYSDLLSHTTALCGLSDAAGGELQANSGLLLNRFLARRLKQCWEMAWWPETLRSQLRYYRQIWTEGEIYQAGEEVYYPTTRLYYRCITTSGAIPTYTPNWTALVTTEIDLYVSMTQRGQDEIGKIRFVGIDDPAEAVKPRSVPYILTADGIKPIGNLRVDSVYVQFQLPVSLLRGADFVAGATYPAGARVYFTTAAGEGDFYTATSATVAGETPEAAPAKWAKQEIPEWLRDAVAQYAAADYLRSAGSRDLAPAEEAAADLALARAITAGGLGSPTTPRFRAA